MSKLFYILMFALLLPNIHIAFGGQQTWIQLISNFLFPAAFYWTFASISRKIGRTIWLLFPFIFFAAFQIVLTYLLGESVIGVDMFLNVVTTNATEINELLSRLLPVVLYVFIIYLPILIMGVILIRKKKMLSRAFIRRQRLTSLILIAASVITYTTTLCTSKQIRFLDDVFPVNAAYNLGLAISRSYNLSHYSKTSADFTFNAKRTTADSIPEIHVLVVGETARAANFGINGYERQTTPLISSLENIINFPQAYSESNTTHKSVPMLLSHLSAENFDSINSTKSVITAYKEAGFKAVFISNHQRNHSYIDFFGEEADECIFIKDNYPDALDGKLIELADKHIQSSTYPLLLVLHSYGSHFNYCERYAAESSYYKPDNFDQVNSKSRPNLINAYDNTIRYTDQLLYNLCSILSETKRPATMLYASDHGEDIFEDGSHFLHASIRPSAFQLHVPLMVWMSDAYIETHRSIIQNLKLNHAKRVSTSLSVFHTLMQIAGITTPYFEEAKSIASSRYSTPHQLYINDHNEAEDASQFLQK